MHSNTPRLDSPEAVQALKPRVAPYWNTLEYCRHIGVQRLAQKGDYWVARVRKPNGGLYTQIRLGPVDFARINGSDYNDALSLARAWFGLPEVAEIACKPYPVGVNQDLRYSKSVEGFTIGDAMLDYIEWKRVAATKSHFETNLSLINCHIIPRLGDVLVGSLNARVVTQFALDVLETPPARGRRASGPRLRLSDLDSESLRKRKKTVNTLLGILRLAIQMAWENGDVASERIWRCIRRLPHKDLPRQVFLNRCQCRTLLSNCRSDLRLLVLGALYTGCRVTELAQIRVCDVEPGIRGVHIASSKNYSSRYVLLPPEGLNFFREQCVGKAENERVFLMASGRMWTGNHKHLFREAVLASGLPNNFVFHGLRHTYASQLVQAGMPLAIVARQLGHSNTDTVSRTYGHLSCSGIEQELERRFAGIISQQPYPEEANKASYGSSEPILVSEKGSWPLANYSRAGGELVSRLTGR